MKLPFPLWVVAGASGGGFVAIGLVLPAPYGRVAFAVGASLILLWTICGIRPRAFGRVSAGSDLADRASERGEEPPAPDDAALESHRKELGERRRLRAASIWKQRRYDFPRAEDHDHP